MASQENYGRGRIGINAHLLSGREGYRRAGIHHYIHQLLNHLEQEEGNFIYTVFTGKMAVFTAGPQTTIVHARWPTEQPLLRIMWEQMAWPLSAARRKLDLLHSMAFVSPILSPCPTIVTVYDLSFIYYPDRYPALRRSYLTSQTRRSCQTARRVVTISESGRQDVHRLFKVPLDRIDVVKPGIGPAFRPRPAAEVESFRRREQLTREIILHVGTLQPRKNIPVLIDAFAQLQRSDLELVLVGGKGWYYEEIFEKVKSLGLQKQVRFTGYVPDADLPLWYNAAATLVFPSIYEGFGMPVLQAMACGTPVIAANTSAIPEVTGQAARLFQSKDQDGLSDHMMAVLEDPKVANTMREQGLFQARKFSWEQAGKDMDAVYQRALTDE